MSKQNFPTRDTAGRSRGSRPASFPNNSLNAGSFNLSKSFKNLKVNDKRKSKRNSLTDSEASDISIPPRSRGGGAGVATNRSTTSNHHARALQEIKSSLEPYAASDVNRDSVQCLVQEYNIDETTAEKFVRDSSGSLQFAREKLIQILTKKMMDERRANIPTTSNMGYSQPVQRIVYQQGDYRNMPGQSDYPATPESIAGSMNIRGSPDGASLRAESPVTALGNNGIMNSKIAHANSLRQMLAANSQYDVNYVPNEGVGHIEKMSQLPRQYTDRLPVTEPPAYHIDHGLYYDSGSSRSSISDTENGTGVQSSLQRSRPPHLHIGVSSTKERANVDDPSTSGGIIPGHVQQMVQRMSPSSPTQSSNDAFFGGVKMRNNNTRMAHQMISASVMTTNHKPVIKGPSAAINPAYPPGVALNGKLATQMGYDQSHIHALPPPSYNVTQKFRTMNQQQPQNYDSASDHAIAGGYSSKQLPTNQSPSSALGINPLPNKNKEWMNSINGALSGNINNLPMYQSSSSVSVLSSSPQSSISSGYQGQLMYDAEPCHASYSTVASAPILQPVSSQPVPKPQPMTAEAPGMYRGSLHQGYIQQIPGAPIYGTQSHGYNTNTNYQYQFNNAYRTDRDPPPYSESSSATNSTVNTDMSLDYATGDPTFSDASSKTKVNRPSVADNYLSAVEGNASSNSNTNCNNARAAPSVKRPTTTVTSKGTEVAIKAALVTGGNPKRHAGSYSAASAAKQQKAGSMSISSSRQGGQPGTDAVALETCRDGEKTIKTSPVPVRRSLKKKSKNKSRGPSTEPLSSDSEEEGPEDQVKLQTRTSRVKMFSPDAYKFYMEQHIENVIKGCHSRCSRRMQLEQEMQEMSLPEKDQEQMRIMLFQKESNYIRLKRGKIDLSMFHMFKPLGVGAFGKVYLACKTSSGALYAIKMLMKKDVLKRNQVAHVKAERDILSEADNDWVVRLYYTFQDKNFLYFVMDYIPGGDMMTLLIKKGIFEESLARFYTAELTLALDSVHRMGFIHRDIKPDNILIDRDGHVKLTDFGLCTGFRWTHDSKYYQKEGHGRQDSMDFSSEWSKYKSCALKTLDRRRIRDANRHVARSLVGTPNYIAPEVLLREGYTHLCDWWSVGVILYEMVVGQPPFNANTPEETQYKVVNWKNKLYFPESARLRPQTKDLILRLCCDQKCRLGSGGIEEIKQHPYFESIDWDNLRKTPAPYIPKILYAEDTSNFDTPDSDLMINHSQAGTMNNNTLMRAGEHAFFEFSFRRFFDEDGRAYATTQKYQDMEEILDESPEEVMEAPSNSFSWHPEQHGRDPHGNDDGYV